MAIGAAMLPGSTAAHAAGPVTTAGQDQASAEPDAPLFGAELDWGSDGARAYADRLGASAAVYDHEMPWPLQDAERRYLEGFLHQAAAEGSHAVLSIHPTVPLAQIDAAEASKLAEGLESLSEGFEGKLFVRFAPDMNSSWMAWGQQPAAYTAAFRAVSEAVHERLPGVVMVWSPYAALDYPYGKSKRAPQPGSDRFSLLDTNSDGVWNQADDAYAPYYPGDAAVDWVGLSAFHDETRGGPAANTVPQAGAFAGLLDSEDFYERYAVEAGKPLMVRTAAFFSPGAGGAGATAIKSAWWQQVFESASTDHRRIGAVVWTETTTQRALGETTVDWRVSFDGTQAAAFRAGLADSALATGPVTEQAGGTGAAGEGTALSGIPAWGAVAATLAAAAILWFLPARRGAARSWAYAEETRRDLRVDLLRGVAIVFVVVNHLGLVSLFQLLSQEAIGVVSGAELFVLLSGTVLGMVYGPRVADGLGDVVDATARRAGKLYLTALAVVVAIFALSWLPSVESDAVTTFSDQGTGAAGRAAAGRTYDLYAGMDGILQYPVPGNVVPQILSLQFGPWQFNIMGLYVILLLASPLILAALARKKAWLVLLLSAGLYVLGSTTRIRLLPSQFEDSFPLLVWQMLFVVGMVTGYHRRPIIAWFSRHRIVLGACVGLAALFALFSWCNPYLANAYDVRLALLPDALYQDIYDRYFNRTFLGPGRVLNVLVVVVTGYALLSAYWALLKRALGWLLIPLGQATLYVFIMHVFLVLVIDNIQVLNEGRLWLNTLAYAAVLALLWVMVRTRFLFRIIPR
jgi:hypothetical protein